MLLEVAEKVYRQAFWMKLYGSPTLKRSLVWSTSSTIHKLHLGPINKKVHKCLHSTAVKYKNKAGKWCWKGSETLKSTQRLDLKPSIIPQLPCSNQSCRPRMTRLAIYKMYQCNQGILRHPSGHPSAQGLSGEILRQDPEDPGSASRARAPYARGQVLED